MKPRERVAAALDHVEPDRCPFRSTFTPQFAARQRADLVLDHRGAHNPHGGGDTYELALGEDLLQPAPDPGRALGDRSSAHRR